MDIKIKNVSEIFTACRRKMSSNPNEAILHWKLDLVYEDHENKIHYIRCSTFEKLRHVYGRYTSKGCSVIKIEMIITSNVTRNGYDRLIYKFDITELLTGKQ